jgi:hypothetical protein
MCSKESGHFLVGKFKKMLIINELYVLPTSFQSFFCAITLKSPFSLSNLKSLVFFVLVGVIVQSGYLHARQAVAESEWIELEFRSPEFLSWLRIYFSEEDLYDVLLADSLADPDGDGDSNEFEFVAKLNPTDREIHFKIYFMGDAREQLRIGPVSSGVTYDTQYSTDLDEWIPISSALYQQVGDEFLIDLSSMPSNTFYRVILSN